MSKIGAIILAAGNSSRLGQPKQLFSFRGRTLLNHAATAVLDAGLKPVVVVTGAYHEAVSGALGGQDVAIVFNSAWEQGMASGIVAGVSSMLTLEPDVEAVIVAVCDQPFISAALLRQLIENQKLSGKAIVACSYAGTVGTPVLFAKAFFDRLKSLSGSEGAKKLLKQYPADMATVPFPNGQIDIDTVEDLQRLSGLDKIN